MNEHADLARAVGAACATEAFRRGEITRDEFRGMILQIDTRHALVTLATLPAIAFGIVVRHLDGVLANPASMQAARDAAAAGHPWTTAELGLDFGAIMALVGQEAAEGTVPPLPR